MTKKKRKERPGGGTRGRWSKYETSDLADSGLRHEVLEGTPEDLYSQTVDPVSGNRLYNDEERFFLTACEWYRTYHQRRFLRATDYLRVLRALGYRTSEAQTDASLERYKEQLQAEAPRVLSEADVREILTMHLAGAPFREIADRFGIQLSTAHHIVTGKLFRSVYDQFVFDVLAREDAEKEKER